MTLWPQCQQIPTRLLCLLYCRLFSAVFIVLQLEREERNIHLGSMYQCFKVLGKCKQTAERLRDWVTVRFQELFWFSSIDSICGIMSITTENDFNSFTILFFRQKGSKAFIIEVTRSYMLSALMPNLAV